MLSIVLFTVTIFLAFMLLPKGALIFVGVAAWAIIMLAAIVGRKGDGNENGNY